MMEAGNFWIGFGLTLPPANAYSKCPAIRIALRAGNRDISTTR
jgi:hypothetical protein